jgi:L-ascorbate metabolism protein UlaG (beta-lactamase superfamily)
MGVARMRGTADFMKTRRSAVLAGCCLLHVLTTQPSSVYAQTSEPFFSSVQRYSNREMVLQFTSAPGVNYRVEAANNLLSWDALATMPLTGARSLMYTDSAAPFLLSRFYRVEVLDGSNHVSGDHVNTTEGDVVIQPRYHATFVMNWNGKMVYVDPQKDGTFTGLPKADLILITHSHSDHFDTATLDAVRGTGAVILAPQDVFSRLTTAQKAIAGVLAYGSSTNLLGLTVEAFPAYNANHSYGLGNGYIVTVAGKRVYIAGDTGDTPEMRQLTNIDIAFLPMNQPYTLTVNAATNVVTAFRPKVVYPYHYSGTTSAAQFKQQLNPNLGIEVRLRKWY